MAVGKKISGMVENGSMIRRMFEAGNALRAVHGAQAVCDFSLGNPDVEPPREFQKALEEVVAARIPLKHGYMANAGYPETRAALARRMSREQGVEISGSFVVMSVGAGGGLNAALKAVIDPGDEVIASVPCFMEYSFYVDNHGGSLVLVPSTKDFDLDVAAIESRIGPKTAALIINSPNNPTGRVYPESTLRALSDMLRSASRKHGRAIALISDEPYRRIAYDGVTVPGIMALYPDSIVVTSHSKDLSLPGERIGCVAVNPGAQDAGRLVDAVTLCTRILGYVNAPSLMQRVVARIQDAQVDVDIYGRKRDLFFSALTSMGYQVTKPEGAFYLFPRAPGGDDMAFVQALQEELILVVPGRGFSMPGWFRIAYCVDTTFIERSFDGFEKVARRLGV